MEERKGKKLLKLLNKWGVSPEEAQAFLDDYDNTPDEEEEIVEQVEDVDTPAETEEVETDVEEAEPTEPQPTDEPIAEEDVNETVEEPAAEEPVEETEDVLPPTEEPTESPMEEPTEEPMAEPQDDGRVAALEGQVEELKSTIDGLSAKLEAALDNLAKSGLVDYVEEQPIGIDENTAPAIGQTEGTSSVIDRLNRGRKY